MDFKGYFLKGIELVKLNRDAAESVAKDENAFGPAVLFFAIGGLAAGLGGTMASMGMGSYMIVLGPVVQVIGSFIWAGILYLLARLFGGKGGYKGYYSALGIGSLPAWAHVVPVLGSIVSLWSIPVAVIVTERVHGISTGRAVAVVLIPFILAGLLILLAIAFIGMAAFMTMMHMGGMAEM